ncbi:uncharacterized protein [Hyperolius riggenbachi]|uniref:uncharacterized protein isoform X3 n=1 Tax=Hyperolius riggenbachi TaxID=752182 RepID=UPI0035A283DD
MTMKTPPFYVKFVNSATLWDRGLYHYTHRQQNERHTVLCPRFIAHMAMSPDEERYAKKTCIKSADAPAHDKNKHENVLPNTSTRWSTSAYTGGRQREDTELTLPRCVLQDGPKSPAPSAASSHTDLNAVASGLHSPISLDEGTIHAPLRPEKCSNLTQLVIAPEAMRCSKAKETETQCNQEPLCSLQAMGHNQSQLLSTNEDRDICTERKASGNSDLIERASSHNITRSSSASLSQLLSFSSLSSNVAPPSMSEETLTNSASLVSAEDDGECLPAGSGCGESRTSPGLYSKSFYGNTDLHQESSYSLRKYSQASDFSSFNKMWHDRFFHQQHVLPPISPQRVFSGSSIVSETNKPSPMSEFGDSVQEAFDELEKLAPHTKSTGSLDDALNGSCGDYSSSDSDICKYTASLTIGFSEAEELLADVRLSLLDHTCSEKYCAENGGLWEDRFAMDSQEQIENFITFSTDSITIGHLLSPSSGVQDVADTPELYSSEGQDNHHNNVATIGEENDTAVHHLHHHSAAQNNSSLALDSSFCSDSSSSNTIRGSKPRESLHEDRDVISWNEQGGESQAQSLRRRRPVILDHSIREEMERQRIAEERRAHAAKMYSKLRNSRPTVTHTTLSMSISRFEDFDFLAKYCIFSQEKLAEYKRAFEAVDADEDGYLDCLQVLMALKEIVPTNALSDAEEFYVYRILEIVDYYVTDGLTDLRLFAVMASLAQKIAALDSFMRSLIDHVDFKALELKMYKAKQLFLCNIDAESKTISVEQLLVELKAGGISREHEEAAQLQLSHIKNLDILDFLTYLPLFVLIHNSVISNPLDDSRKI